MVALGVLKEGGEGAAFLLPLGPWVERSKGVLVFAMLALHWHRRQSSGYVHLGQALLRRRHRSPRRFDDAVMGVAGGSMIVRQPSRCRPPLGDHELLRRLIAAPHLE
jgi:hypothetical protein